MANLEFYDTHNMIDYLKKTEGSEGFHQIVDFLNSSHIRTLDNGEMEITGTIDGKVKIVSEASIRRHLKLEDSDGISNLPTTEIFKQLALMGNMRRASKGYNGVDISLFLTMLVQGPVVQGEGSTVPIESHHTPTSASSTSQPPSSSPSRRTTRQESMVLQPRSPTQTNVADEAASTGVDVRHGGAATTVTSLDAGQGSGNIDKTPTMPHDLPLLRVHTLGSDEGRIQHYELIDLVTKLSDRVVALETDLHQTNKVYGTAFTKLIKKVKKLEKTVKTSQARKKARLVVSDDEEDLEDQVYTAEKEVSTAEPVSTAGASVSTADASSAKNKGKSIIEEAETIHTKTKLQLEQERLGYEEALRVEDDEEFAQRLQSEEREMYSEAEKARLLAELINERKRYFNMGSHTLKQLNSYSFDEIKNLFEITMRRVHIFVPMESECERVILELAAGNSKRDAEEELVQKSSKRQKTGESSEPAEELKDKEEEELSQERIQQMMIIVPEQGMTVEALQTKYPIIDWEIYTEGARKYWKIIRVGNHTEAYQFFDDMLQAFDREDLVKL
ncbi:hypothetical protein Tco_0286528 [Tanacetum coccineum]